jgi:hypothetical protein
VSSFVYRWFRQPLKLSRPPTRKLIYGCDLLSLASHDSPFRISGLNAPLLT